ncbi:hypothetical protein BRARA_H00884 [Brassica rapa]|uniref:F-box associated domain-containing protein n=1 Tax=Brassica campestris TaxID=3711 RepID=A0A397YHG6_BRACM|nr:hypothetical protein BRARA_H00884 [Brassica rapa]
MSGCIRLEFLPSDVNLASLHYLNLTGCARLRSFPRISSNISRLLLGGTSIVEDEDCFFIGIISRLTELVWSDCPMRYMPSDFCAEYLVELIIPGTNPVILLPFIRAAPSLTVSFFYYRDDKAKPCYSHYVYDLNAETENSDEVTQCRCVTEES